MDFVGVAQPLGRAGLDAALKAAGLPASDAACLFTVFHVETGSLTGGFGFRADRRPHILFERHKFRGFTGGRFDAVAPELSGKPGGYGSSASQYTRLDGALALLDSAGLPPDAALKSASWGLGQVMGFNAGLAGYGSAAEMVTAMMAGEDAHVLATARFIAASGLARHVRTRNWLNFALGYNGPHQAENNYAGKLAAAFPRLSAAPPSLEVRAAQAGLVLLGYKPGPVDGAMGGMTRAALARFSAAEGLGNGQTLTDAVHERLATRLGWAQT